MATFGKRNPADVAARRFALALLVSLVGLSGCSDGKPPRFQVSGAVRFADGEPVRTGTIEFCVPGSRWSASGTISHDGSYRLTTVQKGDGAIEGRHQVIIRQLVIAYIQPEGGHTHGQAVNPKYSDYSSSDLVADVKRGTNRIDFTVDK